MNRKEKLLSGLCAVTAICLVAVMPVEAKDKDHIENGVYLEEINVSGMSKEEAIDAVNETVEQRLSKTITLIGVGNSEVPVQVSELGLVWTNPGIVTEAVSLGKSGNIVKRYKELKNLEQNNKVYDIRYGANKDAIKEILSTRCAVGNIEKTDATLTRENGTFVATEGIAGYKVDETASLDRLYSFLTEEWDGEDGSFELSVIEDAPRGTAEELLSLTDVLGSFTTSFSTSGKSRSANVTNGCNLINGTLLYPGDEFSTYDTISPFSEANGYYLAGSYLNGQVVESLGGGICQLSTTLYNAVLLAELEVTERHNHSMIIGYVEPSADAAISESAGKDFRFVNNTEYPIYIEGYIHDKHITFNLYGVESRDPGRQVSYESVVLEKTVPDSDKIYTDAGQPAGYHSSIQSVHIGYKAQLWKKVTENGVQVSKEQINSSTYKASPRSITIGVATEDPNIYNALMAAAASGSADQARAAAEAVAAGQTPVIAPPATEAPQEQTPPGEAPQEAPSDPGETPAI